MAIPLLIDTCILRRLVSKTDFSYELGHLQFLVQGNHITLLAPEVLRKEWGIKHREEAKSIILKSLRELEKEAKIRRTIDDPGTPFLQEDIENLKHILLSQLDVIDDLLVNHSRSFSVTDDMALKIYARQKQGLAPFHNPKKNNINDAEILFSSVDYLLGHEISTIYFVSDNTSDFAIEIDSTVKLHPEIMNFFPGFEFHYFTDIRDTFKLFDTLGLPRWKKTKEDTRRKVRNVIHVDRSKPLFDQVHQYLEERFSELLIIPKKLFTEHYPFLLSDHFQYSHTPFTLKTDNKDLYDLFTAIKFEGDQLTQESKNLLNGEEDERKITEIFHYLQRNFLSQIAYKNETEIALSFPHAVISCDCSLCLFKNFKFPELFGKDTSFDTDKQIHLQARLRTAYGFYKIRDFITAANLMKTLREEIKEQKGLLYYILSFNLYHLGSLIAWSYWDEQTGAVKFGKELQEIDLTEVYRQCRTTQNADILQWIHEKEFYQRTFSQMQDLVDKSRDLYYGQNSGFNESTRSLLEHFYVTEAFLNQNSIIYDIYSEFESLSSLLTEGLFASHSWNTSMGGRLSHFDDFLIEKIVLYGKAEVIRKFFYRFKLKELHYKSAGNNSSSFVPRLQRVLNDYEQIKTKYESQNTEKNTSFWDDLGDILYNGLTIASLVDIKDERLEELARTLIRFLEANKHFHAYRIYKPVELFLSRKHEALSFETLKAFFLHGINQDELRKDEEYFQILEDIFEIRKTKLTLSEEQFALIHEHFLVDGGINADLPSWVILGVLYNLLENHLQKEDIQNYVLNELAHRFNPNRYYYACMLNIIDPSVEFTNQYLLEVEALVDKGKQPQLFSRREYYSDRRLDQFFNYCFKYDLTIPGSITSKVSDLGDYYAWLTDIEEFDYTKFDPKWLSHHFTLHYKQAFRNSATLKTFLLDYIKRNVHSELERTFMTIYCYDD